MASAARRRVVAEGTFDPPSQAQCSALRLFTTLVAAQHVLVLGSTAGVSEAWLLTGMRPGGTLTVIDPDAHRQALTRDALAQAPSGSVRVITAAPSEVAPRLTDAGYDVMIADEAFAVSDDLGSAAHLLRPGGALIIRLSQHEGSRALRDVAVSLREDPRWTTAWLTVGEGLLVSAWHPSTDEAGDDI